MELLEFDARLNGLLIKWEAVEEAIKQAELQVGKVTTPAINELRYAGRHILRALALSRDPKADNEIYEKTLAVAEQYLINADNDVVDAVILYMGRRVDDLNLRFGKASIIKLSPNYELLCKLIDSSRISVGTSRRNPAKRYEIYDDLRDHVIPKLRALFVDLYDADTVMSAQVYIYKSQVSLWKIRFLFSIAVSILLFAFLIVHYTRLLQ